MNLAGSLVHFWLSPAGREALDNVIAGVTDFDALVVEENSIGLWIWRSGAGQSREVTLLKWEYFAAVTLEYQPEVPQEKTPAGFRGPG